MLADGGAGKVFGAVAAACGQLGGRPLSQKNVERVSTAAGATSALEHCLAVAVVVVQRGGAQRVRQADPGGRGAADKRVRAALPGDRGPTRLHPGRLGPAGLVLAPTLHQSTALRR